MPAQTLLILMQLLTTCGVVADVVAALPPLALCLPAFVPSSSLRVEVPSQEDHGDGPTRGQSARPRERRADSPPR